MENAINYYKTYYLSSGVYDCLVVCLSYESIFTYIDALQDELNSKGIRKGKVLIDQLLISGNGKNRFLSINIDDGTFVLTSAQNVRADHFYHQLTSSELKRDKGLLDNSILSPKQISLILAGCVI
ncbi:MULTISPECIES: type II toxin-antitoxin system RnlB family antitoxin [Aminobacterium]|jgi:hypothetical protein|uniref:type II toxin-antitoxin system RnlB family antitoxin n=1 Tax=Aminobacterium TaxID=81466 RepID=UPI00257A52B7|nr:type II toxin-antitoxin system RnlB family antitoxin [Aminobacterium sp. UBA4834]